MTSLEFTQMNANRKPFALIQITSKLVNDK